MKNDIKKGDKFTLGDIMRMTNDPPVEDLRNRESRMRTRQGLQRLRADTLRTWLHIELPTPYDLLVFFSWFHPEGNLFPDPEPEDPRTPLREPFQYLLEAVLVGLPDDASPEEGLRYVVRLTDWLDACFKVCAAARPTDEETLKFFNLLKFVEELFRRGIVVLAELRGSLELFFENEIPHQFSYSWYDPQKKVWVCEELSELLERLIRCSRL